MSGAVINRVVLLQVLSSINIKLALLDSKKNATITKNLQCFVSIWPTEQNLIEQEMSCTWKLFHFFAQFSMPMSNHQTARPFVILTSLKDRTATARASRTQLQTARIINVSDETSHNRLPEANICSMQPVVQSSLTQANCISCLAWARHHLAWTK